MNRRFMMSGLAAIAISVSCAASNSVNAQGGLPPTIKLIVPSTAGGVHDVIGRLWAERMKGVLGTLVIDNRGGAGGAIGVADGARAEPNGATLLLGSNSTHVLRPLIWNASNKSLAYDPAKDFEMITVFAGAATATAVAPTMPTRTLGELIAHAKANPGKLTYAHGGVGAISQVAGEMFKQLAGGLDIPAVTYRGMGPAQADVINSSVSMFVPNITGQVVELHQTGKIRLVSVNAAARHPSLPDIPTAEEAGLPGMITQNFFAIFGPAGLPSAMVEHINVETRKALEDRAFQERLTLSAFDPIRGLDVAQSKQFLIDELKRWDGVIRAAGIKE